MTTPLYALKDLEMKGGLAPFIKRCIVEKRSVRDVAKHLSEKGTPVSPATAYRWMSQASGKVNTQTKQERSL